MEDQQNIQGTNLFIKYDLYVPRIRNESEASCILHLKRWKNSLITNSAITKRKKDKERKGFKNL